MPSDPAPQPRKKPRGALIGGVTALLILVAGGGTAFALRPSGPSGGGSPRSTAATEAAVAVSAQPFSAPTPAAKRWDLPGLADVSDEPGVVQDVDDDRAVVYFHERSQKILEGRLALLDARTRTALWDVASPAIGAEHARTVSEVVGDVLLVRTYETGRFRALDLATGSTLSETPDGVQVLACRESADCSALGQDVVIASDGRASRVPAGDLTAEPRWSVPADEWTASVLDGKLVSGEHAYDLETGAEVLWTGEADVQYSEVGDGLAVGTTDAFTGYRVIDANDGSLIRTTDSDDSADSSELIGTVLIVGEDGTSTGTDLRTGATLWSLPSLATDDTPDDPGIPDADVTTVPSTDGTHRVVVDVEDGSPLFELPLGSSDPDGWPFGAVASRPGEFVFQDDEGLIALDSTTGRKLWTYLADNRDHDFMTIGSHIVRPSTKGGFHLDTIEVS